MTTITIADLATAPQIDSRRVARDLIEWLADRGWVIVRSQIELPFGCDPYTYPYPPAPLSPSTSTVTITVVPGQTAEGAMEEMARRAAKTAKAWDRAIA